MKTICFFLAFSLGSAVFAAPTGEEVYQTRCAACHDQNTARIPPKESLQKLASARILRTLDFGVMMSIAYPMKREDREAVASYLGANAKEEALPAATCPAGARPASGSSANNWNGWSNDFSNARHVSLQQAGLTLDQTKNLKLKWAFGFPGDITAFSAPTVFNGSLFLGSASGVIYALDAKTGCTHWAFQAVGPVRMAPLAVSLGAATSLIFADQIGNVYSVDAVTGKQSWTKRIEDHEAVRLTGSPASHDGVVFIPAASWEETRSNDPKYSCCTFRGSVTALRARDGSVVWKTYMVPPPKQTGKTSVGTLTFGPSGAGIWSAPTIDARRGLMYVTTGDNYSHPATDTSDAIIAIEIKTGKIVWKQQTLPKDVYNSACGSKGVNCPDDAGPDFDFGSSAILTKTPEGREILLAGQKSGVVFGLDPAQKGKVLWQTRVGKGGVNGGVQWGMASDGQKVYAATGDSVKAGGAGASLLGNANYDPAAGGGLTALRLSDGSKAWFAEPKPCAPATPGCSPAQEAAVTSIPGVVFSGSLDGHMRAFNAEDGKVLWEFNTVRDFPTVNGVTAKGGSIDGPGPVVTGGMVFINSGYPRNGGMPGNVLLAFGSE
jgi:polyvinyl alcohol dehydrogenase (cytochrome)